MLSKYKIYAQECMVLLVSSIFLCACTLDLEGIFLYSDVDESAPASLGYNPMHDLKKDSLKILDIGNSYTDNSHYYLADLVANAGIGNNFSIYRALRGSASFYSWFSCFNDMDMPVQYSVAHTCGFKIDGIAGDDDSASGALFRNALESVDWDIILIHQVSRFSVDYMSWNTKTVAGHLPELIRLLRSTNPQATIGFVLIHSYAGTYPMNYSASSYKRWMQIANAVMELKLNYDIDLIIPYGTAVQNLRLALPDENEFTGDGTHLAEGLGRYAASCCYFEKLLAPRFDTTVLGNPTRVLADNPAGEVTDATADVAQKAAVAAVRSMFEVVDVDDFNSVVQRPAELLYKGDKLVAYNYNEPQGDVVVKEGTTGVLRAVFYGCEGIGRLSLPASIRHLGNYAFADCTGLDTVVSFVPAENIFAVDTTVFYNVDKEKCRLYVPYGAEEAYRAADGWSLFKNIEELDPSETTFDF